jgi:hypothetical protein
MRERQLGQLFGVSRGAVSTALGFEYDHRDALDAADRTLARSDLTPWGGGNFDTLYANPGNVFSGGRTWAIPRGQDGHALLPSDLVAGIANVENQYDAAQILPSQRRFSLYAAERALLSDTVALFGDALATRRTASRQNGGAEFAMTVPSSNPFYVNPLGGTDPVTVYYNFLHDLGPATTETAVETTNVGVGVEVQAGRSWRASATLSAATEKQNVSVTNVPDISALDAALADPNPATAFNPFGDGSNTNATTLKAIRGTSRFHMTSRLRGVSFNADGHVVEFPAGALRAALGMDFRQQFFETSQTQSLIYGASYTASARRLLAGFGELFVPIVAPENAVAALRKLELSFAVRHETYSDSLSTITPKFAVTWSPIRRVEIGGTWAQSSRPPHLGDLDETRNLSAPVQLPDAISPTGSSRVLALVGNNAALRAERAANWTLGARLIREEDEGVSAGVAFFNINFTNRIQGFTLSTDMLENPSYASIVTRHPSAALINEICSSTISYAGTAENCRSTVFSAVVDLRLRNVQTLQTRGVDFNESYRFDNRFGRFSLGLSGTYMTEFALTSPPGGRLSLLDTLGNPIRLHMHGSLGWDYDRLGVIVSEHYANAYWNPETVPTSRIDAWITTDVQLKWAPAESDRWLAGLEFRFTVKDVFDRSPPFASNASASIGYDQENGDLTGRFVTLGVFKRW